MFMIGKQCQSCGMPMKKDKQGGGTNVDGSKSQEYCSNCYQNGQFVNDWTVEQMQTMVDGVLVEKKFPNFLRKLFRKQIPTLKRWKQKA